MSSVSKNTILFLATSGFAGYIRVAPGTFGTLTGIPLAYLIGISGLHLGLMLLLIVITLSVMVAERAKGYFQREDPPEIVCDEVAGFCVAVFGLTPDWTNLILGFILFRFFDILKPFPIRTVERRLSGGAGIVADDLVAGVYANVLLNIITVVRG